MFFNKKNKAEKEPAYREEVRNLLPIEVIDVLEKQICGLYWHPEQSISRIVGMAIGGLRGASVFTNEQLNEQAEALSCLTRKTLPLVLHVLDPSVGNSQTLRLPFFRFFAASCQQSVDFSLIARRLSELSLLPVMVIHSGKKAEYQHPSKAMIRDFLGAEHDDIESPTPAQTMLFGHKRRRLPEFWNIDQPMSIGLTIPATLRDRHGGAMRTFFMEPMAELLEVILDDFAIKTERYYQPVEFLNLSAPHQVVTTEAIPSHLSSDLPLAKVNYTTPMLRKQFRGKRLTFIDRNNSNALATALGLSGYSLVHYGAIDERTVQAALQLNEEQPVSLSGVRYYFSEPLSPKEEIYNQQVFDLCGLSDDTMAAPPVTHEPIKTPLSLSNHPAGKLPLADLHRFWAQNGKYLATGQSEQAIATPVLATGILPAGSGKMQTSSYDLPAVRVVGAEGLLQALCERMRQENYGMDLLETFMRPLTQNIKVRLLPGADFFAVLDEAFNAVLAGAGGNAEKLSKQWKNALYLVPPSCLLEEPYASQGGIKISDDSPEHSVVFNLLPNTSELFLQNPDSVLLDKDGFASYVRMGKSAEQEIHHLFSAVASVEAKRKAKTLLARVEQSLEGLELHITRKPSVSLSGDIDQAVEKLDRNDLTLAELAQKMDRKQTPIDRHWLLRVSHLKKHLILLQENCKQSINGRGRASHGVVSQNAAGEYPWSPLIVPWAQNGNGEGAELTLGVWEAHMKRLCSDFIALRQCDLEVAQRYNPRIHDEYFRDFDWRQLNSEELTLCPPLVLTGTDTDFFRNTGSLNELFRSGAPVKVLIFDTLRANPAAPLQQLLGHRMYVLRGSLADRSHLLYGFTEGFKSPQPALLQVLSPDIPDYEKFSRQAQEDGLYPLFSANHADIEQNSLNIHPDAFLEQGFRNNRTFAELVKVLPTFARHFSPTTSVSGKPVAEYITLDEEDQAETMPVVKTIDEDGQTKVFKVSSVLIDRVLEQQRFKAVLSRFVPSVGERQQEIEDAVEKARQQMLETVTQSLIELADS